MAASALKTRGEAFLDETGRLYALLADVVVRIPGRPFDVGEVLRQTWFIASVSLFPALLLTVSFGLVIASRPTTLVPALGRARLQQGRTIALVSPEEARYASESTAHLLEIIRKKEAEIDRATTPQPG